MQQNICMFFIKPPIRIVVPYIIHYRWLIFCYLLLQLSQTINLNLVHCKKLKLKPYHSIYTVHSSKCSTGTFSCCIYPKRLGKSIPVPFDRYRPPSHVQLRWTNLRWLPADPAPVCLPKLLGKTVRPVCTVPQPFGISDSYTIRNIVQCKQ